MAQAKSLTPSLDIEKKEAGVTELRAYFSDRYFEYLQLHYPHNYARDGKILKDILKSFSGDIESAKRFVDWFFQHGDDYVRQKGYSIPLLKVSLVQYHAYLKSREEEIQREDEIER